MIVASVDATDSQSLAALAGQAVREFGRLDIWFNNAGIYPSGMALNTTDDDWHKVIDLDLSGVFYGSREAAQRMVAAGHGGVILNTSSGGGFRGRSNGAAYIAAKHGVQGITKSLAIEFGPLGIRVLGLAPTLVETPGTEANRDERRNFGMDNDVLARMLPLGRIGLPDDIARVALFCVSDMAMFMTGSTLFVDGGHLAM